jgi:hypothetical protein
MVRLAHSRAIAISTRWTPAGWSVGRSRTTRSTRPLASRTTVWPIASLWPIASRSAVGSIPGPRSSLPILSIALAPHDYAPSLDHGAIHTRDHSGRVGLGHFDERVTLLQIDLSNAVSGNSALPGDDAHEISDLHSVARPNRHEETRHSSGTSSRSRTISRLWPSGSRLICLGQSPLSPLAL